MHEKREKERKKENMQKEMENGEICKTGGLRRKKRKNGRIVSRREYV